MKLIPLILALAGLAPLGVQGPGSAAQGPTEGALLATNPDGKELGPCPLEHTDVQVQISGFVARVIVTQKFHNPYDYKIEGVYVFPLSQDAAVDDMTMTVGDRVVRGVIKPREEARQIYEAAKAAGHVAGLLDQERPNIFTQSVANIEPGARVEIQIAYVENLDWTDGTYHFDFPMVVGPRYIPGGGSAPAPMTSGTPTPEVPDADQITPPVVPEGMRAGHDVSLTVRVNAGLPIREIKSTQHEVDVDFTNAAQSEAVVTLKNASTIPNRDFVLTYQTATEDIGDALLTHFDARGGFFTLILQPPARVPPQWIVPREMIFVIDKSGSMNGFPIETAKLTMRQCIENLKPQDTFNLMTFEGGVGFCFDRPVPNTADNRAKAQAYLANLQGSGGTEMMKAIDACLARQEDPQRVRIVCFMTDGYVGNDMAIIDAVRKNAGVARVFSFGIGHSVNRYLLDGMARAGRGEVEYVLSSAQCDAAAQRFSARVSTPVLTDVQVDWGNLQVDEVYPKRIPDLFNAKPVVIKGRYTTAAAGVITLRGRRGNEKYERQITVALPGSESRDTAIASLWARAKVEDLMNQDLTGVQQGNVNATLKDQIVTLGLEYRLLTQFTSFVAVEELTVTRDGAPAKVLVPVEMPEGVSYDGVFGRERAVGGVAGALPASSAETAKLRMAPSSPAPMRGDLRRAPADQAEGPSASSPALEAERLKQIDADHGLTPEQKQAQTLQIKLAAELQGLAAKVGEQKDYREGKVIVRDGRIEIAVYLADVSEKTLSQLKTLGLDILFQTRSTNLVVGTIDVKQLETLALLDTVRHVQLAAYTSGK